MDTGAERGPRPPGPAAAEGARSTKERLLDAAERLFAAQGVAGTSLRSITAEAGVNVAAVHYHFGSREALLRAVLARRVDPVNRERLRRLEALEAGGASPALEALLEAFLAPAVHAAARDPDLSRVSGLLFQEPQEETDAILAELFGEVVRRFHAAFAAALPALGADELRDRFGFVVGALVHELAGLGPPDLPGLPAPDRAAAQRLGRLVTFCAAGLRAPGDGAREEEAP